MIEFRDYFQKGQDFVQYIPEYKIKQLRRYLLVFFCLLFIIGIVSTKASALTYTTYDNLLQNNTNVTNLLSLIPDDHLNDDYVVFRSGQYEYCLVFGSLDYSNGNITSSDTVNIIKFDSQYNSNNYLFSTDSNFTCVVSKVVSSNLNFDGASHSYNQYNKTIQRNTFMVVLCFLPLILAFNLRAVMKNEYV